MTKLCLTLLFVFAVCVARGATWYVEKGATGANTGVSWLNAWHEMNQIVWASVSAGDTVYLGGGDYTNFLYCTKAGTEESPITVRASQEAGHNGMVYITNGIEIAANWVTVNGSRDDSFATNIPVSQLWSITNNIGIDSSSPNWRPVNITAYQGVKVFWVKAHHSGWNIMPIAGLAHGIAIAYTGSSNLNNMEIGWCLSEWSKTDGISVGGNPNADWGNIKIHHCIIRKAGDDGVQVAGGVDVYQNIIGQIRIDDNEGHPDTVQTIAFKVRIYNNELYSHFNSWLYFEAVPGFGHYDWLVYGNVCIQDWIPTYGLSFGTQFIAEYPGYQAYLDRFVVANNTIVGGRTQGILTWYTAPITNLFVTNGFVANNIVCDVGQSTGRDVQNGLNLVTTGINTNNFKANHNIVAGWTRRINYGGTFYTNGESFNELSGAVGNSSAYPLFVDTNSQNYQLAMGDTAARNTGISLTTHIPAYTLTNMPGYDYDLNYSPREVGGEWNIGAYGHTNISISPPTNLKINTFRVGNVIRQ